MQVKLLTARVGNDFSQVRGDIIDVPADEAARMVAGELAVYVDPPANAAATTRTADEPPRQTRTATKPTAGRGRKPRAAK